MRPDAGTRMAKDMGLGFRVQGSGFRVQGLGFRVLGLGFTISGVPCWGYLIGVLLGGPPAFVRFAL